MIDAKRSFEKILREWGHDVYIQRILANGNHSERLEKVTTRHVGQNGRQNALSEREMPDGNQVRYEMTYYFQGHINPKEGDRIYEGYSFKASKNYSMYRIEAVTPMRGRNGKIVFWVAGASREK